VLQDTFEDHTILRTIETVSDPAYFLLHHNDIAISCTHQSHTLWRPVS